MKRKSNKRRKKLVREVTMTIILFLATEIFYGWFFYSVLEKLLS